MRRFGDRSTPLTRYFGTIGRGFKLYSLGWLCVPFQKLWLCLAVCVVWSAQVQGRSCSKLWGKLVVWGSSSVNRTAAPGGVGKDVDRVEEGLDVWRLGWTIGV